MFPQVFSFRKSHIKENGCKKNWLKNLPGLTQSFWQPLKQQIWLSLQSVSLSHMSPRRSHRPSSPNHGFGHWPGFVSAFWWASVVFTHIRWQPLKQHFSFSFEQWKSIPHSSPRLSQKPVSPFHGLGHDPSLPAPPPFLAKISKYTLIMMAYKVAFPLSGPSSTVPDQIGIENYVPLGFCGERKIVREPGETIGTRTKTNNKLNPHKQRMPGSRNWTQAKQLQSTLTLRAPRYYRQWL